LSEEQYCGSSSGRYSIALIPGRHLNGRTLVLVVPVGEDGFGRSASRGSTLMGVARARGQRLKAVEVEDAPIHRPLIYWIELSPSLMYIYGKL